jgi:predicted 2-oxoglutarate/Fe(II)-dependent dioxygenase YbiX
VWRALGKELAMTLVKLEENIFKIPSFLSADECDQLIELSESIGFKEADIQTKVGRQLLANIRNNERVDYQSNEHAELYWQRLSNMKLPSFEGKSAIALSPYFRFYKYLPGQKFNMHKDGRQHVGGNETLFTFLIYLNEGCLGGETLFRQGNLKVSPEKGSAIIFEHHLWHQGVEVESGIKLVLRSDIVYS